MNELNESVKRMLCRITKNDVNRLKRKKELTPLDFSKIALYDTLISQGCKSKPKKRKKKSDFAKIMELREKMFK